MIPPSQMRNMRQRERTFIVYNRYGLFIALQVNVLVLQLDDAPTELCILPTLTRDVLDSVWFVEVYKTT